MRTASAILILNAGALFAQSSRPEAASAFQQQSVECFADDPAGIRVAFVEAAQVPPSLAADIYLDGGRLGAPIAKGVPFSPVPGGGSEGYFKIPPILADARKPLVLRLIPQLPNQGNAQGIVVRVTPVGYLRLLLAKAANDATDRIEIVVFGSDRGIRPLLESWKIAYTDNGADPPGTARAKTIVIGSTRNPDGLPSLDFGSSVFVTVADPLLDADVMIRESPGRVSTIIQSVAPADWTTSPRLHRLLGTHLLTVIHAANRSMGTHPENTSEKQ